MDITASRLKDLLQEAGVPARVAQAVDPAQPLLRQGLDSVDFPAFCSLLEERFGLALGDEEALRLRTLEDFIRYIAEQA